MGEINVLSSSKFIRQSLEFHLFFARIMKEHSFFLQVGFTPKNSNYIDEAKEAMDKSMPISQVTDDSLKATTEIMQS